MSVNTVTFTAADGKSFSFPYKALVAKGAVVASRVNGEELSASVGGVNQLWVPGMPGKYFVRDIKEIEFTEKENPPEIEEFLDDGKQFTNRPNVSIKSSLMRSVKEEKAGSYAVGEHILFEGYADDYDRAIVAIQFSLDQGKTWTTFDTAGSTSGKWVYWSFSYTPETPGSYLMKVRSVNDRGEASPLAAVQPFIVV